MSVRDMLATNVIARRRRIVAAIAGTVLLAAAAVFTGDWKGLVVIVAIWVAGGLWSLETRRLRRVLDRRVQDLEQHARELGLTPSATDSGVHEGVGEHGRVRVWVEEPPMLRDDTSVVDLAWRMMFAFCVGFATLKAGVIGLSGVFLGAVLLSVWTSRRTTINVEFVTETGLLHRTEVHRSAEIRSALAPLPAVPGALGFSQNEGPSGQLAITPGTGTVSPIERED
jgi:hypothetical protein